YCCSHRSSIVRFANKCHVAVENLHDRWKVGRDNRPAARHVLEELHWRGVVLGDVLSSGVWQYENIGGFLPNRNLGMIAVPDDREIGNAGADLAKIANIVRRSTHDKYTDVIRQEPGGFRQSIDSLPTIKMTGVYDHTQVSAEAQALSGLL